jgi:hypothetical protein
VLRLTCGLDTSRRNQRHQQKSVRSLAHIGEMAGYVDHVWGAFKFVTPRG